MATYTKEKLSGADSKNTPIDTGSGSFTWVTVHQSGTSTTVLDEVWLWISNSDNSASADISLRAHDGLSGPTFYNVTIPPSTTVLALGGFPISGDGSNAQRIQVFAVGDGSTWAYGYVNRITP
jgi:hypothetical protein